MVSSARRASWPLTPSARGALVRRPLGVGVQGVVLLHHLGQLCELQWCWCPAWCPIPPWPADLDPPAGDPRVRVHVHAALTGHGAEAHHGRITWGHRGHRGHRVHAGGRLRADSRPLALTSLVLRPLSFVRPWPLWPLGVVLETMEGELLGCEAWTLADPCDPCRQRDLELWSLAGRGVDFRLGTHSKPRDCCTIIWHGGVCGMIFPSLCSICGRQELRDVHTTAKRPRSHLGDEGGVGCSERRGWRWPWVEAPSVAAPLVCAAVAMRLAHGDWGGVHLREVWVRQPLWQEGFGGGCPVLPVACGAVWVAALEARHLPLGVTFRLGGSWHRGPGLSEVFPRCVQLTAGRDGALPALHGHLVRKDQGLFRRISF